MCGIIGEINFRERIDVSLFNTMRDALAHRGPDGAGTEVLEGGHVALGHRRLSIIDLSQSGKQPMTNEDGTIWITFNGEIYNFQEIRTELVNRGHRFRSHTDTEVIIHGYEEWGIDVVQRLKGMFAFALWDSRKQDLYLVRDRFGMKPLYYYQDDHRLLFGSEIKAIIKDTAVPREIDLSAVRDFLVYRYIPSPKSVWKGIRKLLPASFLKFNLQNRTTETRIYWQLTMSDRLVPEKEATEKLGHLMQQAVKEHLVSDVPVGLFLSGGLDSSALAYYGHKLNYSLSSYSIGFQNWHQSEHEYARSIAEHLKLDHHEKIVDSSSIDLTEKLVYFFDEPFAASSMIPGYIVSGVAAGHVKVILAGDGGDELLGGYDWYQRSYNHLNNGFSALRSIANLLRAKDTRFDLFTKYNNWGLSDKSQILKIFDPAVSKTFEDDPFWFFRKHHNASGSVVKNAQYIDTHTFLPEACNTRADRCGMAHSIEVRVPYQDHELFEYVLSLKESVYFSSEPKKKLLYENISGHLPKWVLDKPKKGFSSPLKQYLNVEANKNNILKGELVNAGWINAKGLKEVLDLNDPVFSWGFYLLDRWYAMWR